MFKKILLLPVLIIISIMVGCGKSDNRFFRVDYSNIPQKVQKYIDANSDKNGVYLYTTGNKQDEYVYFNSFNVVQGEKAAFFKDIRYDTDDDRLNIYFSTEYTDDYSKINDNKVIYKLSTQEKIKRIDLHKNGTHVPFDIIGN